MVGTRDRSIACYRLDTMAGAGIYVEIPIKAGIDEIWRCTQVPDLHELWDLRFTSIHYLPKESGNDSQRFSYSTRIGLGLTIEGEGESTGTREDATGIRTSALKFWSADRRSLIEEGSGYWRYVPTADGVTFLTWYDYRTRWGAAGRLIDRLLFRPLIGWATAWSFDRLRLWTDRGVHPRVSMRLSALHAVARIGVAFIWLWHGLVPKLLFPSVDEKAMLTAAGLPVTILPAFAVAELVLAAATLVLWRWRPLFIVNVVAMAAALAGVAWYSPAYLTAAFNPVTLNVAMMLLSIVGYVSSVEIPSASRCLRRPLKETA
jgi:hypothetical protein